MTLQLTVKQRIGFTNFLGSRPGENRDSKKAARICKLLDKVRMPEEEYETYFHDIGNGQAIIDNPAIRRAPAFSVEITPVEVKLLIELFDKWEPKVIEEWTWARPVIEQIDPTPPDEE